MWCYWVKMGLCGKPCEVNPITLQWPRTNVRPVSTSGRGQLVEMLTTFDPHGVLGSKCILFYLNIVQPLSAL